MIWRILPTVAVAAAIVAAALAVIGGSNHGGGGLDPVANAAESTAKAGSAEFGLAGQVTTAGQTIPIKGSGAVDMRALKMRMTISTTVPGLGDTNIDELMDGTTIYMHMPQLASRMPGGKSWMKVDLAAFGKSQGVDLTKALQQSGGQQNPADMLSYLKGVGNSRVVGHEAIRGADTTHYSATIDIGKALDRIGDKQAVDSLKQLESTSGVSTIPVDVWVDRSGLVRREHIQMSMTPAGSPATAMDMTVEFLRFGVSVDTTAPPADQVLDLSSLVGSLTPGSNGG